MTRKRKIIPQQISLKSFEQEVNDIGVSHGENDESMDSEINDFVLFQVQNDQ